MKKTIILLIIFIATNSINSQSKTNYRKLIKFTENYKVGYKDEKGTIIVPNIYDAGSEFEDGVAIILVGDKRGYLRESDGQLMINPQFQDASLFHYGLAAVKKNDKYGYIDYSGKFIHPNIFENAFDFIEGVARVQVGGKWGLLAPNGKWIVSPRFEEIYDCSQGLILVKDFETNLYGYMSPQGTWSIKPQYKAATPFIYTGQAMIKIEDKYYYIDTKNQLIGEVPIKKEEWEEGEKEKEKEKEKSKGN